MQKKQKQKLLPADKILEDATKTYRERSAIYGDNFRRIGQVMHAHFPNGLTVKTPEDWLRLYFFMLSNVKATRYVSNWHKGGHKDSVHDPIVYHALLEALDDELAELRKRAPVGTEACHGF